MGLEIAPRGPELTLTEPIISWVRAPPPPKPIHREKTVTLIVPLEIAVESNARPVGIVVTATIGSGDSSRPFTLKSL